MDMHGQIKIAVVFGVGLMVGLAAGFYVAGIKGTPLPDIVGTAPALSPDKIQGTASLDSREQAAVAEYRAALIRRARSSAPLTGTERSALATALLTRSVLYHFTSDEMALLSGILAR